MLQFTDDAIPNLFLSVSLFLSLYSSFSPDSFPFQSSTFTDLETISCNSAILYFNDFHHDVLPAHTSHTHKSLTQTHMIHINAHTHTPNHTCTHTPHSTANSVMHTHTKTQHLLQRQPLKKDWSLCYATVHPTDGTTLC